MLSHETTHVCGRLTAGSTRASELRAGANAASGTGTGGTDTCEHSRAYEHGHAYEHGRAPEAGTDGHPADTSGRSLLARASAGTNESGIHAPVGGRSTGDFYWPAAE